jgi:hypothetical protein
VRYLITANGCDDRTQVLLDLTDDEATGVRKAADLIRNVPVLLPAPAHHHRSRGGLPNRGGRLMTDDQPGTSQPCVTGCGRPTADFLCGPCGSDITDALGALLGRDGLCSDLEITLTRQAVMTGDTVGHGVTEPGLPYHAGASELGWVLRDTITAWVADLANRYRNLHQPGGELRSQISWLAGLGHRLRLHPDALALHDEITSVVAAITRLIDRPAQQVYCGPCEAALTAAGADRCPAQLYARPGAGQVRCHGCGADHDVADKRQAMVDYAAGLRVTATVALGWARILLDHPVPRGTWDSWIARRRLLAHGVDRHGHAVYRFGDVRDLVLAHIAKPRKKYLRLR